MPPINLDAQTIVMLLGTVATNVSTEVVVMPYAPNNGEVLEAFYFSPATVTGNAVNFQTVAVTSQAGLGATNILVSRAFNSTPTNDAPANIPWPLTLPATPANAKYNRGDTIKASARSTTNGQALNAASLVQVTILNGAQAH